MNITLPWPVPSPDEKGGWLSMGIAPPPHKKPTHYRNIDNRIYGEPWKRKSLQHEDL